MKNLTAPKQPGNPALLAQALFIVVLAALGGCAVTDRIGLTNSDTPATPAATLDISRETQALEFSPDGETLAVVQAGLPEIQIWDWKNKRIIEALPAARGVNLRLSSRPIKFSRDGKLLAACLSLPDGNIAAQIWSTSSWTQLQDISDPGHSNGCDAVDFTRDGLSLLRVVDRPASFEQGSLVVYDTQTWKIKAHLNIPGFHPYSLALSPDNHTVALGGEKLDSVTAERQIVLVDLSNMRIVRVMPDSMTGRAGHIAWSPDGAYLASTGVEGVEIFDLRSGEQIVNDKTNGRLALVHYSHDGRYLIESGFDRAGDVVRIWDAQHHDTLQVIAFTPSSMAVSKSGNYFALGGDRTIHIWHLR